MEEIKGYVDHIIYSSQETGYVVFTLVTEEEDEYPCVGTIQGLEQGESLKLTGEMGIHPSYGVQFKVATYERLTPEDSLSAYRYLASGAIKGIGEAMASKIIARFGDKTFYILENEPERLTEIKGISERKAQDIARQVEEKKDVRDAVLYLQNLGISNAMAVKIYNVYGDTLRKVIGENPYRLAEDVRGIGFAKADEIAVRLGISADSDFRIACGITCALNAAATDGNMYLPKEKLLAQAAEMLSLLPKEIEPMLPNLVMERKLKITRNGDEECVYLKNAYYTELNSAALLRDIAQAPDAGYAGNQISEEELDMRLRKMAKEEGLEVDEHQLHAVKTAIMRGVMILTGGPGTGKTTTIKLMLHYFEANGLEMLLAAPTGRAARRMAEATGYEASTIHRLLEISPVGDGDDDYSGRLRFERNEDHPLEADVVILDEMSMVDAYLFHALLRALVPGTRLILVGDSNQLPSVGPGQVLRDLIASERIDTVVLDRVFRQAEESDIIMNAHRIHKGLHVELRKKDFFLIERDDYRLIYKQLVLLVTEKLPAYLKTEPDKIQVLTPMRKGNLGVERLNTILQEYVNPPSPQKKECPAGDGVFRMGDKVMQIKNNYQIEWEIRSKYGIAIDKGQGVFNGDIGRVSAVNEYAKELEVTFDENKVVTYSFNELDQLELAYAVTIHKSQGSEYPAVILVASNGPTMLMNRNLLYTGVTRAKNLVVAVGSKKAMDDMVDNELPIHRYTGFEAILREVLC